MMFEVSGGKQIMVCIERPDSSNRGVYILRYCTHLRTLFFTIIMIVLYNAERINPKKMNSQGFDKCNEISECSR